MGLWRDYDYCLTCKDWIHFDFCSGHVIGGHVLWGSGNFGARYYFGRRMFAVEVETLCQMQYESESGWICDAGQWLPDRTGKWKVCP